MQILALLALLQPYSIYILSRQPKPSRSNATSSAPRQRHLLDTKAKVGRATNYNPSIWSVSEEDRMLNKLMRTKKSKMNLDTLAKYFKKSLHTYQQQPSNFFKSRNKTEDNHTKELQRQIKCKGSLGTKDNDSLLGARET
ncbi:hypothetical protein Tco_0526047 [Tanacetum coccineum]